MLPAAFDLTLETPGWGFDISDTPDRWSYQPGDWAGHGGVAQTNTHNGTPLPSERSQLAGA